MNRRFFSLLFPLLGLFCAPMAWSQDQEQALGSEQQVRAERARIAAERESVEKRFAGEQAQCYQRFAVNDCLQESRVRRRDALSDLQRQETSLNDAERKKKGAEQTRKVEEKLSTEKLQRADEQHRKAEEAQARRQRDAQENAQRREQLKEDAPAKRARQQRETVRHSQEAATRAQQAAQGPANASRYEEKLKDAADYKAKRDEKRAKKTKPAAQALPQPPT